MAAMTRALAALLWLLPLASTLTPGRRAHQPVGKGKRLLTFNETSPSATLTYESSSFNWIKGASDGLYLTTNANKDAVVGNIVNDTETTIVKGENMPDDKEEDWINSKMTQLLVAANATKQYRYSYFADYFIIDVESEESTPLADDQVGDIQYAEFSPTGDSVAFVRGNNLFLRNSTTGKTTQITSDGGPDMFHGVPDWVYEEEIFGGRSTLWFSPDAKYLAFLSFNETGVETFTIPYYMNNEKLAPTYPRELELRYPKVGSTNPTVQLSILNIASSDLVSVPIDVYEPDNLIIGEVSWVTDTHDALIYRAFNRVQDLSEHVLVTVGSSITSKAVRKRDGTDGWLENNIAITYVGLLKRFTTEKYYADLSDEDGWNHIYLYPVNGGDAIQVTKGEWEVASILAVDAASKFIYFQAAKSHSTERHIYKVSWATKKYKITPLVDDKIPAYWAASFSPGAGYCVFSYQGPDVPYQEAYRSNSTTWPLRLINDNQDFYDKINEYRLPNISYFELEHPDGWTMNVMQQLPPKFDPKKKYPVLFTPYGGPNSQSVTKRFQSLGWKQYISSDPELQYITYTVDNRGTGFRGREYRSAVTSRLGSLEPHDQVWAASKLGELFPYINRDKIGMWGWSYGGYLTAKTLEYDSGIFSFGLITAPVTDWRFYDSMYTERYMKTIETNAKNYTQTAVHDVAGFKNVVGGFSIMHGTGDDNVHYQHTAAFLDFIVSNGVSPDQMRMLAFTDSDHSINYNGADTYLYKFLTERLYDEVLRGKKKEPSHQWSKRQMWNWDGK
ncbi:dipeptidyl peptidase IV N-terminal region-domain-containing protein [Thelonectria olida]|uniref:Probable dipeptidyl-aminopeptidase B n=1 Tax=Thelonectria olida TaxID=1576542 RepID=A0A9P9AS10_9HYPO|nr:dipeptidyl peptidase IV N-terminal region-domain-containing protein [Thelonectria olida]